MHGIDILEKIVAEKGDCSWAKADTCEKCPMSKLKKRDNGNYYSCVEALGVLDLSEEEQNTKYEEVAKHLILDINIEEMLRK